MPRAPEKPSPSQHIERTKLEQLDSATIAKVRGAVELRERLIKKQVLLWLPHDSGEPPPSVRDIKAYIYASERDWYELAKELIGLDEETLWRVTKKMLRE